MPQMRVPNEGRIEDIWVNYKSGEWQGIAKGRNIRSYEFEEQMLADGKALFDERKKLQSQIKRCLEADVVTCDVQRILQLCKRAKEVRGTVLALDVLQAETFLKYRKKCIKYNKKMQRRIRGCAARRRVQRMRYIIEQAKLRHAETQ